MTRGEKIMEACGEDIHNIDKKLHDLGHYFILYTHTYEQVDEPGKHILSIPNDARFDDAEFYGLIIDMIRDYASNKSIKLGENPLFAAFVRTLKKLR